MHKDIMIDQHKVSLFKELFDQANNILVIYAPDALRDHLFAATALYKTFQQIGNKQVSLLSSESLASVESDIVYLDETKSDVGKQNLCISLDYLPDSVEKITSAIDEPNQKLHLTIKPKKGVNPLSAENVTYSYTGADADMVIMIGVDDLESLNHLYYGYENLYQSTALISINSYETSFGNLKLDILGSSCVSEYVANLLKDLNYQLDNEVATNLLAGIDEETDNLESYMATAETFETVAYLLKNGARRFARVSQKNVSENSGNLENSEASSSIFNQFSPGDRQVFFDKEPVNEGENQAFVVEENVSRAGEEQLKSQLKTQPSFQSRTQSRTQQLTRPKRGRGRPKGSKNKKWMNQDINRFGEPKNKSKSPKPGDLGYNPSGFGPTST
jgi:hypothetical protein